MIILDVNIGFEVNKGLMEKLKKMMLKEFLNVKSFFL